MLGLSHHKAGLLVLGEVNILALVKGDEHYIFIYDDHCREEVVEVMRHWAADPRLSFSWFDAAVLSQRVKQKRRANTPRQEFAHPGPERHRFDGTEDE